jgi:hypothetical protein
MEEAFNVSTELGHKALRSRSEDNLPEEVT